MRSIGAALVGLLLVIAIVGCGTSPTTAPAAADVYLGYGEGATLGEAMASAKMDAVRKAVVDLIGAAAEEQNAERLQEVLYSTSNPNAYVYNETMETLRKDGSLIEGDMVYEVRIRVNVGAVRTTLESSGIMGAAITSGGSQTQTETQPPAQDEPSVSLAPQQDDWGDVTEDEQRFIRRYVETMTFMVYFSDDSAESIEDSAFVMKSAVNQANSYLVSNGRFAIDADQVEEIKDSQETIYIEETGRDISILQWVAQQLNADVYVELDAQVEGRTDGDNHYGTADVTVNMYETSTGQILGSLNRRSQNTFSRTSESDAILNAIQSTVFQAMPQVLEMSTVQMTNALRQGLRYELVIQNPPDARTLSRFRSSMRDRVREIATVSQAPEEVRYEVFMIGSTDDMVDLVYDVTGLVAGLEDLYLVVSRGRSITFDAGY